MAKLGEGDDRWIVSDRVDGTNVNQWHWQELDCLSWAKARLEALLGGKEVLRGEGNLYVKTTSVEKCSGECYVNRRKGKIIPGYELELVIGWQGEARAATNDDNESGSGRLYGTASGSFSVPYLGDENADDDADVKVLVKSGSGEIGDRMRQAMLKPGVEMIRAGLRILVKELSQGGPALAADLNGSSNTKDSSKTSTGVVNNKTATNVKDVKKKEEEKKKKSKDAGRTIKITQSFYCRPMDIYESLMDDRRVKAFTNSDAKISRESGGEIAMFNGNILGSNLELVPGEKIVQKWRFSNWGDGVYSTVNITITESEKGNTKVSLVQTGVPEEDKFGNGNVFEHTERGWKENIFHRIRTTFGYGV